MSRCTTIIATALMLALGPLEAEGIRIENDGRLKMEARRHRLNAQGTTRLVYAGSELRSQGQVVVIFVASLVLEQPGDISSVAANRELGSIVAIGKVELTDLEGRTFEGSRLVFRAKDRQWILDGEAIDVAERR